MIQCEICKEYYPPEKMWIVSPFPLFSYFDSSICDDCFEPFVRFMESGRIKVDYMEPPYGKCICYTNYAEMRDNLCKRAAKAGWADERECPICEGIMGEGFNEEWDCLSFTCLNCGYEVLNYEIYKGDEINETRVN